MLHDDETRSSAPQAEATDEAVLLADAGSPLQPVPASAETHAEAGDEIMLSEGAGPQRTVRASRKQQRRSNRGR